MILVTGGAGFIGSNFIRHYLSTTNESIVNIDKVTYAGNLNNLEGIDSSRHHFSRTDICDRQTTRQLLATHRPTAIVHFAAESHVDRSIHGPAAFVETNMTGTFCMLDEARLYWEQLPKTEKDAFRFLHVSTDEVYGSLSFTDAPFTEESKYHPNSPYSASKAGADHLVRAYYHTYGLPTVISNCSNNYGPRQHPEKLIPITIINALNGKPLPLYGDGCNERNWLFADDHCRALATMLAKGTPGEVYLVGETQSRSNKEVMETICSILDELRPESAHSPFASLIASVTDRPGHDLRYDIDASKITSELGWTPQLTFEEGIRHTVEWYLNNNEWITAAVAADHSEWIKAHYGERYNA
ncbi:dTDP-glucose 4,6-dehydratase [Chlamydiales bacterium SCGC AG-110-P3]|nr:dTDP-glucose 4,6-dehydratase [Chlamydiales bacterium SCGC AG-110-P3]